MANDQSWQRRSDEWVKASHQSRKRKEAGNMRQDNVNERSARRPAPDSEGNSDAAGSSEKR